MTFKNICRAFVVLATVLTCSNASNAQNTNASPVASGAFLSKAYQPWLQIAMKDIVKRKRVWEDVSLSEKNNNIFGLHNSGISLAQALINGVMDAKMVAYSNVDDRFTTALTPDEFSAISEKIENNRSPVTRYMIKEDSLWLNTGKVIVRILGIAPFSYNIGPDGIVKEQPLFWVFYPDCRSYLAGYIASGSYSWDNVLEGRYFTGQVIRASEHPTGKEIIQK